MLTKFHLWEVFKNFKIGAGLNKISPWNSKIIVTVENTYKLYIEIALYEV